MEVVTTKQKNKVINCWNDRDYIGVKFEKPDGTIDTTKIKSNWYFAIWKKDAKKTEELLTSLGYTYRIREDSNYPNYLKVYTNDIYEKDFRQDRRNMVMNLERNNIETFEGDLLNDRRWYIDQRIEISSNYKKLYFDIETDDTIGKIEIGRDRILSIAGIDNQGETFFYSIDEFTDEAESKMLKKFLKLLKEYDIILGWNTSGFDIPYIKERTELLIHDKSEAVWKRIAKFDLLKRFRHIFRFDSQLKNFHLDFISNHFLGRGKVKFEGKIIDLWKDDKKTLKKYNLEDCQLVKDLDEKLGVSDMMIRQSQWCGVPPSQFGLYSIIDAYILKKAHSVGVFGKTSISTIKERKVKNERGNINPDDTTDDGAKYTGALVLDPIVGKYDKVYTFDFKGLYPSMMRTSNIGYDTLRYEAVDGCIVNPGTTTIPRAIGHLVPTYFDKQLSVINLAISDLINKRGEYKKLKLKMIEEGTNKGPEWERVVSDEIIVKEIANSTYGIMGLEYGRYFSIDIAESITLFGQWCLLFAKKFFESRDYKVIYGDTDSVFISTGKEDLDVKKELELFHKSLKQTLKMDYNIDDCYIELNFDKQYDSFILLAKKTYVGHVINIEGKKTDDLYVRGLDYIKRSTFKFGAKKQKELIELLLKEFPNVDIHSWMTKAKEEFYNTKFEKEDLILTQKIDKEPEEYRSKSQLHVSIAARIKEKTGQKMAKTEIDYIVTGHSKNLEGIPESEFDGTYDPNYYWENKTQPLLERITNVVYPGSSFYERQGRLL